MGFGLYGGFCAPLSFAGKFPRGLGSGRLPDRQLKLSQGDLGKKVRTSGDIIGRYERDEVTHSVEVASKLADVLDVSLDYRSGKTNTLLDSTTLSRIMEISVMPENH